MIDPATSVVQNLTKYFEMLFSRAHLLRNDEFWFLSNFAILKQLEDT